MKTDSNAKAPASAPIARGFAFGPGGVCQTTTLTRISRSRKDGGASAALPCHARFRKARFGQGLSQLFLQQPLTEKSRTCFEGPFGELLRATGPMAKANPFRFSTKCHGDEKPISRQLHVRPLRPDRSSQLAQHCGYPDLPRCRQALLPLADNRKLSL